MKDNPTKQQKIEALTYQVKEDLENLTIELDERVKNIKILVNELTQII